MEPLPPVKGVRIAPVEYDYDLAGNVLSVVLDDSLTYPGDATVSYTYDDLHRLTRETCVPSQGSYRTGYDYSYSYDAVGNRTGKTIGSGIGRLEISYGYSARNELMGETTYEVIWNDEEQQEEWVYLTGWYYGYDLRGNLASKADVFGIESWYYTWSADDKLTQVHHYYNDPENPWSKTVEYKYDLLGRRIAKRVTYGPQQPGPWRWYFYDGLQVVAEGSGTSDKSYYTLSPGAIGGIIARDNNGTKLWYHFDRLGNVMAVTDSNGNAYAVYTMEAFGGVRQKGTSTGYYSQHPTDPQPYHLTTKEYDPDTGLYYLNARWYEPVTGRFDSGDPKRFPEDNQFAFGENNPMSVLDPSGEVPVVVPIGIGVIVCEKVFFSMLAQVQLSRHASEMCKVARHFKDEFCYKTCLDKLEGKPVVATEQKLCRKWLARWAQWCPEEAREAAKLGGQIPGVSTGFPPPTSLLKCKCSFVRKCLFSLGDPYKD